jgi:hypothetical protein
MAGREKIIGIYRERNPYYLKLFLFLGAVCHSGDSFLSCLLTDSRDIKRHFIPFVQDT